MLDLIVSAVVNHITPNWVQFGIGAAASAIVGGVVLFVLRLVLKGAVDTIKKELEPNGGASIKDQVTAIHNETVATRGEVVLLRTRFDEHLKYLHREGVADDARAARHR